MQVEIQLFGALRGLEPGDRLLLEVAGTTVADARNMLMEHAGSHWPADRASVLVACAFASNTLLLRDAMPLPEDGGLVVLPPVNGG
ncbi:MAG: MoaD/ThiS family protein [Arenimonas sp.]|nr:MoaD/ThiS family protein [Arenimonas sp.]MBP7982085.1 MoaD/ThiS family protein [Arenimonas sp.]